MCIFFLDHFPLYRYCSFCINQHAIPDFFSFFSWRKILNALQDVLEKALENFIVMFFEIQVSNPISLISFIYHVLCVSLSLSISRQKSRIRTSRRIPSWVFLFRKLNDLTIQSNVFATCVCHLSLSILDRGTRIDVKTSNVFFFYLFPTVKVSSAINIAQCAQTKYDDTRKKWITD